MIDLILQGENQLFHELIRPYERRVYMMALSFLHNESDAEDAAQQTFLKAYRKLSSFRGEAKFGTWLLSIAMNEARSRLRREKTMPMESLDETDEEGATISPALLTDWREIPSEALERKEIRELLNRAVVGLPPMYREIFMLRDVEQLSIAETAEMLCITVPAVKVRLHRARLMLQKILVPQLKYVSHQGDRKRRWFPWS